MRKPPPVVRLPLKPRAERVVVLLVDPAGNPLIVQERIPVGFRINTECENCYGAGCGWCATGSDWDL